MRLVDMGDLTFWLGVILAVPGLLWNVWPLLVLAVMMWVFLIIAAWKRRHDSA